MVFDGPNRFIDGLPFLKMGGSFHGYVSHNQRVTLLISVIELFKYIDLIDLYGYESIPIDYIFRGMNIHLPAILMFTRGTRF